MVHLTLPDGQKIDYTLPCISASISIEELVKNNLYILIPFQQVQLNKRMNQISNCKIKTKHKIAQELYAFHQEMKKSLEKLYEDAIISLEEFEKLIETFSDVEGYLVDKDSDVKEEVELMGDQDYVSRSERAMQEGYESGQREGYESGRREGYESGHQLGHKEGIEDVFQILDAINNGADTVERLVEQGFNEEIARETLKHHKI